MPLHLQKILWMTLSLINTALDCMMKLIVAVASDQANTVSMLARLLLLPHRICL